MGCGGEKVHVLRSGGKRDEGGGQRWEQFA